MNTATSVPESVVRKHLQAFLELQGVPAIVADYAENARLFTEAGIYHGKTEIAGFFTDFISALPANGIERLSLRGLRVDQDVALLTWCIGSDITLGADTFVVADGKIVSQTFAMQAAPVPADSADRVAAAA